MAVSDHVIAKLASPSRISCLEGCISLGISASGRGLDEETAYRLLVQMSDWLPDAQDTVLSTCRDFVDPSHDLLAQIAFYVDSEHEDVQTQAIFTLSCYGSRSQCFATNIKAILNEPATDNMVYVCLNALSRISPNDEDVYSRLLERFDNPSLIDYRLNFANMISAMNFPMDPIRDYVAECLRQDDGECREFLEGLTIRINRPRLPSEAKVE